MENVSVWRPEHKRKMWCWRPVLWDPNSAILTPPASVCTIIWINELHGERCDSREYTCCVVWLVQLSKWLPGKQFPKDREESCQGSLPVKFACQRRWCIWISHALTFLFQQLPYHFQGFHNFAATYPFKGLFLSLVSPLTVSPERWVTRVRTDRTSSLPGTPYHPTCRHPTCRSFTSSGTGGRFDFVHQGLNSGLLSGSAQEKDVKSRGQDSREQQWWQWALLWKLPGSLKPHNFSVLNNRWAVEAIIVFIPKCW